jgi:hypothetical protein
MVVSRITDVQGESHGVHGGDESASSPTITGVKPLTANRAVRSTGTHWRLDWGPPGRRRLPYRPRKGVSEVVATRQAKRDPRSIVSAHRGMNGKAGRWHGPCPDAGKPATGGVPAVSPRRTRGTVQANTASIRTRNTPHPSRGRRIAHTPGIASPDLIRLARSCQRGRGSAPLSRAGILALQGGEDVKNRTRVSYSPYRFSIGVR